MSFIRKWLRPETSSRIGLRPHRDVELAMPYDDAYERVRNEIERTLGATVYVDDRAGRMIEAGFGLVRSERLRCSFDVARGVTKVRIEAFFPAGATIPDKSTAVDALAQAIASKPA
jgi:hypothetical protein